MFLYFCCFFFFFKQKTAYEMRISDWSSDVCSSDLAVLGALEIARARIAGAPVGKLDLKEARAVDRHVERIARRRERPLRVDARRARKLDAGDRKSVV